MNATPTNSDMSAILAIDLGKYKSVTRWYPPGVAESRFELPCHDLAPPCADGQVRISPMPNTLASLICGGRAVRALASAVRGL
jgi:hypothetical protein